MKKSIFQLKIALHLFLIILDFQVILKYHQNQINIQINQQFYFIFICISFNLNFFSLEKSILSVKTYSP